MMLFSAPLPAIAVVVDEHRVIVLARQFSDTVTYLAEAQVADLNTHIQNTARCGIVNLQQRSIPAYGRCQTCALTLATLGVSDPPFWGNISLPLYTNVAPMSLCLRPGHARGVK